MTDFLLVGSSREEFMEDGLNAHKGMFQVIMQPGVREKDEAYDSRSNPFQEGENDAGASKDQRQIKVMSIETRRGRVMLILRRRRGRLKLFQDFDHHFSPIQHRAFS